MDDVMDINWFIFESAGRKPDWSLHVVIHETVKFTKNNFFQNFPAYRKEGYTKLFFSKISGVYYSLNISVNI